MYEKHPNANLVGGIVLLAVIPLVLLNGLVFSYLWEWFVLPINSGIADVTVLQASGIVLLVGLLTVQFHKWGEIDPWGQLSFMVVSPLFTWLLGYIVHILM